MSRAQADQIAALQIELEETKARLATEKAAREEAERLLEEKKRLEDRVARLESNIDHSVCLDAEGERIHFGARVVCGQCFGSQEQHLKNARAERDALKARHEAALNVVEAARAVTNRTADIWSGPLGELARALAAFDAVKPEGK